MLPHEYKPPSFYTGVEGGDLIPWTGALVPLWFFEVGDFLRGLTPTKSIPYINCQGYIIHSLLWVRYGDRPEDYVIQERWDCINGFTDIDPRFPMMKGRDIFRVL